MTKEQLVQLLATKYGHIDYWSLAAKWKRVHHEQVADMIIGSFEAKSAAAPDLLVACENLLARLEQVDPLRPEGSTSPLRDYARNAIAAASVPFVRVERFMGGGQ